MFQNSIIEIHGHRGARGLYPENTITSFLEAVKLGVNAIELDVVISKDNKVIVSHEPYMNDLFCSKPDGSFIAQNSKTDYNLYQMLYSDIIKFDCGIRGNPLFPSQTKLKEHKPLLSEVVTAIDSYTQNHHLPYITYDIEIKSELEDDGIFQPNPKAFVDLVYKEVESLKISHRCILQSFDVRILQELKKKNTSIPISYLVENTNNLSNNIQCLGFIPDIYAPEFILINEQLISELKQLNIKLITWTVNELEDMKRLINMGVTTIITDYPDRAINLIKH